MSAPKATPPADEPGALGVPSDWHTERNPNNPHSLLILDATGHIVGEAFGRDPAEQKANGARLAGDALLAEQRARAAAEERVAGLEMALRDVRAVAADREAFVMMGPRAFSAAVAIVDRVLADAAPSPPAPVVVVPCPACNGRGWHVGECHPREVCGACDGSGRAAAPVVASATARRLRCGDRDVARVLSALRARFGDGPLAAHVTGLLARDGASRGFLAWLTAPGYPIRWAAAGDMTAFVAEHFDAFATEFAIDGDVKAAARRVRATLDAPDAGRTAESGGGAVADADKETR